MINKYFVDEDYYKLKYSDGKSPFNNIDVAFKNLIEVKNILELNEIVFMPAFGTLLGLFRDKALIAHDIDIDIIIDASFFDKFVNSFNQFNDYGFRLVRSLYDGKLLTIEKNYEHIDFYFFNKIEKRQKALYVLQGSKYKFNYRYFARSIKINVGSELFTVPLQSESILRILYGKSWLIPIKDKNYNPDKSISKKIKFIYSKSPKIVKKTFRKFRSLFKSFKSN